MREYNMNDKKDISEDDKIEKALKHAEKRFNKFL